MDKTPLWDLWLPKEKELRGYMRSVQNGCKHRLLNSKNKLISLIGSFFNIFDKITVENEIWFQKVSKRVGSSRNEELIMLPEN